jgi:hypothetical protein
MRIGGKGYSSIIKRVLTYPLITLVFCFEVLIVLCLAAHTARFLFSVSDWFLR